METLDYDKIRADLQKKNLYDIQKELTIQRRTRTLIMGFLALALVFTFVFGTLKNPFEYTLSNIGNFFNYRLVFILWSFICGIAIETSILALFKLENYKKKSAYIYIYLATFFLIVTGVVPALKDAYPFWHYIHIVSAILLAIFFYLGLVPFSIWISKENPRLRIYIAIWQVVIWAGSIVMLILKLQSALFEMWFFSSTILFLLYLCLTLFEERIIKISVRLMMDEDNLNLAIEKIFVNLDNVTKQQKRKLNRKKK